MRAIISRKKLVRPGRHTLHAWVWIYSVKMGDKIDVTIDTRLGHTERWAKEHGATEIVRAWEKKKNDREGRYADELPERDFYEGDSPDY